MGSFHRELEKRTLGRTGLRISCLGLGAGPVSGLMTGEDVELQSAVFEALADHGINWIDTAAGYGNGLSEIQIGRALKSLSNERSSRLFVATKVRIDPTDQQPIAIQIRTSLESSLARLGRSKVELLQVHNGLTEKRSDEPASISLHDLFGNQGVLPSLRSLQKEGMIDHVGLTGTGHAPTLRAALQSDEFDTIQIPYNLLNPSAGQAIPKESLDRNYGNVFEECLKRRIGVFAIRVFAGGALLDQPPSPHTYKTPFFPLALYHADLERAKIEKERLGKKSLYEESLRFPLAHPAVHCALIGFGSPAHVRQAAMALVGSARLPGFG